MARRGVRLLARPARRERWIGRRLSRASRAAAVPDLLTGLSSRSSGRWASLRLVEGALTALAERRALFALGAAGWNRRVVQAIVVGRSCLVEVDVRPVRAVLTEVPDALSAGSSVARRRRRKPAPLLLEPARVQLEPPPVLGDLDRREPADVLDPHGGDLSRGDAHLSQPGEEVIVLPVCALEAFVEQSHPIEHRPRHHPEGAVEAARLD